MSTGHLLYVIAIGLILFSLIGFFVCTAGAIFHLFLVVTIIAILLSVAQANRVAK